MPGIAELRMLEFSRIAYDEIFDLENSQVSKNSSEMSPSFEFKI